MMELQLFQLASRINARKVSMAQYAADARLFQEFERSGKSFNYAKSVLNSPKIASVDEMNFYLSKIQRGGLIQPFGCMFAIEEPTFKIIGYSENCYDLLGLEESKNSGSLLGVDARTLLTSSSRASLVKAVASKEISLLNPLCVHFRSNHKPFYAILHRIDVGLVIDLEPAQSGDPTMVLAGAVWSQKLAVRAISRLQSLPGGDIGVLCDTVVEDIQKLTGYDRVMVYKFHGDGHGEVVSEVRRSDLEPYLGLHYPAIDIPQAARFLFQQNRVRIICDCNAHPVKIIQSEELPRPLSLINSTLRSPHSCHNHYMANMGSVASLVLAIVVSGDKSNRLWGLAVCHHTSPRYVPFPLRYACEFLMQAFAVQLHMELQLAAQMVEKKNLRMQTVLCDMLLRDIPYGIVTRSPSIMDLVKCDGAAMFYGGKCWLLGVTPTESQVKDIVQWLLNTHLDFRGLSTDSLADAGYPGASLLGDAVCGMTTARISSKDFLFWFRSHTEKEVKWGGSKHHPEDRDDDGRMHPRCSFKSFLEVVKNRSLPWEVPEINAIYSLQIMMRDYFQDIEKHGPGTLMHLQQSDSDGQSLDELSSVANEMVRLIETATAPIFGVDVSGSINGWNAKIAELTGLQASEAIGKSLVNEIVHEDSRGAFGSLLYRALQGEENKNIEVKLQKFQIHPENEAVYLVVNACTSRDYTNEIVGVCFVGQDVTSEKVVLDRFIRLQGDYMAIVQSPNPLIPPIFASDENACCSEWNVAMEKLTGCTRNEVISKILPGEVFGGLCQLKSRDVLTKFMIVLHQSISGHDTENMRFGFFDRKGKFVEVFLTANKRVNEYGAIIGCFCFLQTVPVDQPPFALPEPEQDACIVKLKEWAYICQQMKSPLNGLRFTHKLLEGMDLSDYQKQLLETRDSCERQIVSIIGDINSGGVMEGKMQLNCEEFTLGNVIDAIVSQVMVLLREKNLQLTHDIPDQVKTLFLYGDQINLQLLLTDFLISIAHHTPSGCWVEIKVCPGLKSVQDRQEYIHLQFRLAHPGEGLPSAVLEQMSGARNECTSQQGIALNICYNLVSMMNGRVRYIRDQEKCYFRIDLELRTKNSRLRSSNV